MSVVGLGSDIASVSRMQDILARHGERFLQRCFRPDEVAYILSKRPGQPQAASAAARWAAKEAFLKALGLSVAHIPYRDVEVVRDPAGPVSLRLHGRARESLGTHPGRRCLLSLSHERENALAVVLIED